MFYKFLLCLTILFCFLELNRTVWSITNRSKGQHLKFVFNEFSKPSYIFRSIGSIIYFQHGCWAIRSFLSVEQFISPDKSISSVLW